MTTLAQQKSLVSSEGKRFSTKNKILQLIRISSNLGMTINDLCTATGRNRSTITGRISELHDDGLIKESGNEFTFPDGSTQTLYYAVYDKDEQMLISYERNREKIIKSLKILKNNKQHLSPFINKAIEVEFMRLNS